MAAKRKISIRKVLQVFTTFVATISCIIAIISASTIEGKKTIERVEVHINSGKKYHFIEAEQILNETINNRNIDVMHIPVNKLDIQSMERVLKADPWVADASLYVDAARVLHISVTQRIPLVRLFQQNGTSCYMDNTYCLMPLAPNFNYYTSVVTNVPMLNNDSAGNSLKKQIALMINTIQSDTFWNAQISQVIIDSDNTFELIPVLGQQKIVFGDTSRMKEKFSNLYAFYMNVLNRIGWDKYETLDIRFKGQVVAAPSLPFKGPTDKVTASMNWINSIMQTEARIDSMHADKAEAKAAAKADTANNKKEVRPAPKNIKLIGHIAEPKAKNIKPEAKKADPHAQDKKENNKKDDKKPVKKEEKKDIKRTDKKDSGKKDTKEVKPEVNKEPKTDNKRGYKKDDKKPEAKKATAKEREPAKKEDKKKVPPKEPKKEEKKPKYTLPENKEH